MTILQFKPKPKQEPKPVHWQDLNSQRYYCKRCNKEHFYMRHDGNIYCAGCGAWMKNLALILR